MNTIRGDYTNLHATADLDLRNLAKNLGTPAPPTVPLPKLPTVPSLPLPSLPSLPAPSVSPPAVPPLQPLAPNPTTSTCVGAVCPGLPGPGSAPASWSSDSDVSGNSWLSLMWTGMTT